VSYAIDVNILLFSSNDASVLRTKAQAFLAECVANREVFCLAWLTVMSYVRMATHPTIFQRPLSPAEALHNVHALLSQPHCRALGEEDGFLQVYQEITNSVPTRGNLVPDAHLAAVLSQHGVVKLFTHDRDFRKFTFLDVHDPFA
jgi:uncharacterized protein